MAQVKPICSILLTAVYDLILPCRKCTQALIHGYVLEGLSAQPEVVLYFNYYRWHNWGSEKVNKYGTTC